MDEEDIKAGLAATVHQDAGAHGCHADGPDPGMTGALIWFNSARIKRALL